MLLQQAEEERASSHFAHAARIYKKLSTHPQLDAVDRAQALLGLADMERIQGDFQDSLKHYAQGAKVLKKADPALYWDAQVGWALAARACGRPTEALSILQKAIAFYKRQKDPGGEAFTHWALGGTYRIAGDMKKGLQELLIALRAFKKLKELEGIAYTCCALGGIFRMLGRYAESGKYYREANRRMRQRKDTFGIAYSYCGLGNVKRMDGRFKQALPFYKKAERLYGTIGDRVSYAYTLWSIGTTHKMLGQYSQAHWAFYKADSLFKETGDTRGRIYSLLGFVEIEIAKGNFSASNSNQMHLVEKILSKSNYSWERLHFWSLIHIVTLINIDGIAETLGEKKAKKVEKKFKKVLEKIKTAYRKSGSRFFPSSLPINWP
jgi:tetratricopeptide (TPR) repeat protein